MVSNLDSSFSTISSTESQLTDHETYTKSHKRTRKNFNSTLSVLPSPLTICCSERIKETASLSTSFVQQSIKSFSTLTMSSRIHKARPRRAAAKALLTDEQPGIVFRIHIASGPLILRYPSEYKAKKSLPTSPTTHQTPIWNAAKQSTPGTRKRQTSNTQQSVATSIPTSSKTASGTNNLQPAACECFAITGIHGAHIVNCYLVRNSISPSLQTASSTVLCSSCRCLPFIEIFEEGRFQLCISCATKFERVKRKCCGCHYIPRTEERNRRQCSQCKTGVITCY